MRRQLPEPSRFCVSAKISSFSKASGDSHVDGRSRRIHLYDGKLVPWRSATTHVLTHSLHYGLRGFRGVRAYKTVDGTAIFRLADHTERLFNSPTST